MQRRTHFYIPLFETHIGEKKKEREEKKNNGNNNSISVRYLDGENSLIDEKRQVKLIIYCILRYVFIVIRNIPGNPPILV